MTPNSLTQNILFHFLCSYNKHLFQKPQFKKKMSCFSLEYSPVYSHAKCCAYTDFVFLPVL